MNERGILDKVVRFALRYRVLVIAAALALLADGIFTATRLPVDVFPDLNRPTVTIMAESHALSPEEVELLVTRPIETAMNGAPGVERVRSQSGVGLSIVWVEFGWDTDLLVNRQMVAERLQTVRRELPDDIDAQIGPISSIMGEIMLVGVKSDEGLTAPSELRAIADFVIRRELLSLKGVAQVIALGGGERQVRVRLDPERLAKLGVTADQVIEAARLSQGNTAGGFLDRQSQELLVRMISRTADLEVLQKTPVTTRDGVVVRLADVADLELGPGVMRGDAGVDGDSAVILSVQKQPGASTTELTGLVEESLRQLQAKMPSDVVLVSLFRQSEFIESSTDNVTEALRDGAILVVLVLFLFLQNLRTTFITLTAIPLSLGMTFVVFDLFDIGVNTMTLGGIAVAIGELVDDAIVDTENVFRRLRENRQLEHPRPALRVVWDASIEVRGSIVFATLIVVLVFVPLFGMSGLEGRLFAPLALAYIIAILSSLVVSVTVTPVLCSYLLPRSQATAHDRDGWLVRWLKRGQTRLLNVTLRHPFAMMGAAFTVFILTLATVPLMGREFLPAFNEGTATINLQAAPGVSLETSNQLGHAAEALILSVPEVKSVGRRTGRAEMDEHAEGVHYAELDVDFKVGEGMRERSVVLDEIRQRLAILPGTNANIGQPISHRLDHLLSGVRAELVVKVKGPELATLRRLGGEIEAVMKGISGLRDVAMEKIVLVPQLRVLVDRETAERYGFKPLELAQTLERLLDGEVASQVLDEDRRMALFVRLADEQRANLDELRRVLITTPSGAVVPLEGLARLELDRGPNTIVHDNGQRRVAVYANIEGRDLNAAVAEVKAKLASVVDVPGYGLSYEGQFASQEEATVIIGLLSILSLLLMVLVLFMHFRSGVLVAMVMVNIPQALIGSVFGLWVFDLPLSVATLVGFVALCGIASRNTIMMLDHYLHLVQHEGMTFSREMVVRGSLERLVPVLMTAVTAGLGLIPLVLSADAPGKEILHPVAVVIFFGLMSSTLLDLIVTPAAFWAFGKRPLQRRLARAEDGDGLEDTGPATPVPSHGAHA
ncbi:MAG TPA: efflux RND transporter permease subunit [Myxococcota bacterium]|nr:efflux RND transporter permease subunit [Myxococcota bacterium]